MVLFWIIWLWWIIFLSVVCFLYVNPDMLPIRKQSLPICITKCSRFKFGVAEKESLATAGRPESISSQFQSVLIRSSGRLPGNSISGSLGWTYMPVSTPESRWWIYYDSDLRVYPPLVVTSLMIATSGGGKELLFQCLVLNFLQLRLVYRTTHFTRKA